MHAMPRRNRAPFRFHRPPTELIGAPGVGVVEHKFERRTTPFLLLWKLAVHALAMTECRCGLPISLADAAPTVWLSGLITS